MGSWKQAAALYLAALLLFVFSPMVLVLIPFACLVFTAPEKRFAPLAAGTLAMMVALAGVTPPGLWYVERGWTIILGGVFAALTLRWPGQPFLPRAIQAVAISMAGALAALGMSPRRWGIIDEMVASRLRDGAATFLEAMREIRDGAPLPGTVVGTVFQMAEWQSGVFPAMLALSSLAGLGVAWWLHARLARGRVEGLAPLGEFRCDDQWVWVMVLGVVFLLLQPGDPLGRAGLNLLVFAGALHMVRGAGVLVGVTRGVPASGRLPLALAFLLLAPFLLAAVLLIGLADVWLDIRARVAKT